MIRIASVDVIEIGNNTVRWLQVERRLRSYEVVLNREWSVQDLDEGEWLKEYVQSSTLQANYCALVISPDHCRFHVLDTSHHDQDDVEDLVQHTIVAHEQDPDQVVWSRFALSDQCNVLHCMSKGIVHNIQDELAIHHVYPIYIGTGLESLSCAIAADDSLFESTDVISYCSNRTSIDIAVEEGKPTHVDIHQNRNGKAYGWFVRMGNEYIQLELSVGAIALPVDYISMLGVAINMMHQITPVSSFSSEANQKLAWRNATLRRVKRWMKPIGLSVAAFWLILLSSQWGLQVLTEKHTTENAEYAKRIDTNRELAKFAESIKRDIGKARSDIEWRTQVNGYLEIIGSCLPNGAWLSAIVINDQRTIHLEGYVNNAAVAAEYLHALQKINGLGNVMLQQLVASQGPPQENSALRFNIAVSRENE